MILADTTIPIPPGLCTDTIWTRINGWEVVVSVLLVMAGWAATNIARMYFMVKIAEHKTSQLPKSE